MYEIERITYKDEDELTELELMLKQLNDRDLSRAELNRRRRKILKDGEELARKEAYEAVVNKGEWAELPKNQRLPGMSLETLLAEDGGDKYYTEREQQECEKEGFRVIESAMQDYLGPQGRYILDNLGEDGTLTLAQIGQIYNETKEFIEAKEMEIDIVSKDADREIEKLLKDGHKDKADKKDAATVNSD